MAQEMQKKLNLVKQASDSMNLLSETKRRLELAEQILELVKAGSVQPNRCTDVYEDAVNGELRDESSYAAKEASATSLSFGEIMGDTTDLENLDVRNTSGVFNGAPSHVKEAQLEHQRKDAHVDMSRPGGIFSMTQRGDKSLEEYFNAVKKIGQRL